MKNKSEVVSLFKKYGFDYRDSASNGDFLAFTYKYGFFHNAELISLYPDRKVEIEEEMEPAVKQLEALGFSTKKSFYKSVEELEEALFDGFFNVQDWKEKIKREYLEHCEKILSVLPKDAVNYNYINVPFLKNGENVESKLIEDICSGLKESGPALFIVEAPAGFGKTCTSYEILNTLASHDSNGPIPFFTEFSRDRQARVFSHIFVKEVDRSFSSVNSDVVIGEVKEGRIAVVLDGFDEILHDSNTDIEDASSFEEAEPMLETIGELLTGNAKIILTSRRSAIFDGEVFSEWVERYQDKFLINRYRLEKPEVKDWLQPSRLEALDQTEVDVERLANPVLLSFLRFVDDEKFNELCEKTELIVDQYFKSMLEREIDRQELRMSPEQQEDFLRLVASDMCDKNYTSDSKERLIKTIKEKAGHIINDVRKLYSAKDRPSIDKMATTLSNHAFFDRSSRSESHIEFINEFVFGNYIAANILNEGGGWISSDERFVEPAVLSYTPRSYKERSSLWKGLLEMKYFLDASSRMKFEWLLTGNVKEPLYEGVEVSSVAFKALCFFESGDISNSVFNDCMFTDCFFDFKNFDDVTFINCSFWGCSHSSEYDGVNFYNCKSDNGFSDSDDSDLAGRSGEKSSIKLSDVEYYILTKIWPVGSPSIERLHHFIGVIIKTDEFTKREVVKGIKMLKRRGILQDANNVNFVEINKDRFSDIKQLLGRT